MRERLYALIDTQPDDVRLMLSQSAQVRLDTLIKLELIGWPAAMRERMLQMVDEHEAQKAA